MEASLTAGLETPTLVLPGTAGIARGDRERWWQSPVEGPAFSRAFRDSHSKRRYLLGVGLPKGCASECWSAGHQQSRSGESGGRSKCPAYQNVVLQFEKVGRLEGTGP